MFRGHLSVRQVTAVPRIQGIAPLSFFLPFLLPPQFFATNYQVSNCLFGGTDHAVATAVVVDFVDCHRVYQATLKGRVSAFYIASCSADIYPCGRLQQCQGYRVKLLSLSSFLLFFPSNFTAFGGYLNPQIFCPTLRKICLDANS